MATALENAEGIFTRESCWNPGRKI